MAEPETVAPDETQEITDEMKEKLLLNLFGNAMNNMKATPPTKETGQGDSVAEDAVEAEEKQKGDQSENLRGESATAESPNREGSGPAVEAVQTPDGFSSSEKKDESGMKALLELEDKLKSEEETLTPGELEVSIGGSDSIHLPLRRRSPPERIDVRKSSLLTLMLTGTSQEVAAVEGGRKQFLQGRLLPGRNGEILGGIDHLSFGRNQISICIACQLSSGSDG